MRVFGILGFSEFPICVQVCWDFQICYMFRYSNCSENGDSSPTQAASEPLEEDERMCDIDFEECLYKAVKGSIMPLGAL